MSQPDENPKFEAAVADSVRYLASADAAQALLRDAYWPKWHSPWWHMLLLHEMGETHRIPEVNIRNFIASMNRTPLKIFPLRPEEIPPGIDPNRDAPCHCHLGNMYQVLAAYGINVDQEIPWVRPWFLHYQLADGGFNCDSAAYLVEHECASSMVATIAIFEAVLLYTDRPFTAAENLLLGKAADFLIRRALHLGSPSDFNAAERESAKSWMNLCFPRFYFYDVLRGLNALLNWEQRLPGSVPAAAIEKVVTELRLRFPDGQIRIGRKSFAGTRSVAKLPSGKWSERQDASFFPLLTAVSAPGEVSPFLSARWAAAQRQLVSQER